MSYIALKHAHMGLAYLTVILFIFRGLHRLVPTSSTASLSQRVFDYVSYAVDIPLLVLGLMLLSTLQINPAITPWIGTKLVWLVVYIVLGVFAYRPVLSKRARWLCFGLAILCWVMMFTTAKTHLPFWQWLT
ncbi:MAG TPA: SirB2 family protein [Alcanivoracaceae bacterium]|nr:SirB2 family protein [Alcanivoracaceae bacterium]